MRKTYGEIIDKIISRLKLANKSESGTTMPEDIWSREMILDAIMECEKDLLTENLMSTDIKKKPLLRLNEYLYAIPDDTLIIQDAYFKDTKEMTDEGEIQRSKLNYDYMLPETGRQSKPLTVINMEDVPAELPPDWETKTGTPTHAIVGGNISAWFDKGRNIRNLDIETQEEIEKYLSGEDIKDLDSEDSLSSEKTEYLSYKSIADFLLDYTVGLRLYPKPEPYNGVRIEKPLNTEIYFDEGVIHYMLLFKKATEIPNMTAYFGYDTGRGIIVTSSGSPTNIVGNGTKNISFDVDLSAGLFPKDTDILYSRRIITYIDIGSPHNIKTEPRIIQYFGKDYFLDLTVFI